MSRIARLEMPAGSTGPVCRLTLSSPAARSHLRVSVGLLRPMFHRLWAYAKT